MNWGRWYRVVSYSRSSLWIVPVFAVVIEQIAIRLTDRLDPLLDWGYYGVGVNGAQGTLDAVATMTLSFIVFTFGSLLVAIQVASGQLTPRVIATTLLRNDVVRYTVGLFTFTFLYSLGMRARTETSVNDLGLAVAVVSALGSIVAFLFLIDYAARLLRPVAIVTRVGEAGLKVIEAVYPRELAKARRGQAPIALPGNPNQTIDHQGKSGIVLAVNLDELTAEARRADCVVEFVAYVGDFVGVDEPLFRIYGGGAVDEERLRAAVAFGPERTMEQDPLFSFRILVDIAIKALSKAINDPTTAVLAIDQLHRLLRKVGRRHTRNEQMKDAGGALRVVWRTPNWEDFVRLACVEIRTYGAENMQVARRLRAMIENLIQTLPEHRHPALRLELDLLDRSIAKFYPFPEDAMAARVADAQGLGGSGMGPGEAA
jgi:uncharacterized membrane protein